MPRNRSTQPRSARLSRLCLNCGLCCNGVIFADVCLVPGDVPARLASLGLSLEPRRQAESSGLLPWRFCQPCILLDSGNACRGYAERPLRCRAFECGLYQRVARGELRVAAARRRITMIFRRVRRVERLLRQLGDAAVTRPLFARVRSVRRRFERTPPGRKVARVYADLTVAAHALRQALSRDFTVLTAGRRRAVEFGG